MLFRQIGHTTRWRRGALLAFALLVPVSSASAQYYDQIAMADMLNHRAASLEAVPEVSYRYYRLTSGTGNSVYARNTFFLNLGKGDTDKGQAMAMLVGLLNRTTMNEVYVGDTLVVPTDYGLDFRAYSPFPRHYAGGREFDKLFIMDKTLQAFAAYEYGDLVRWGIINTGNPEESPTPNGRYNFNWREPRRVSSLSPPGEEWQMYWVVNFHQARGMHIHQYEMPTGGPMSHGCVRLVDADAEWAYNWADTWTTTSKGDGYSSGMGSILEQGTTVLVIGTEPEGKPQPFVFTEYAPALKRVELPAHPYDVPPGTAQQRYFDRRRPARPVLAAEETPAEKEPMALEEPLVAEVRPTEMMSMAEDTSALNEPVAYEALPAAEELTRAVSLPVNALPVAVATLVLREAPEVELLPVYDLIAPDELIVAGVFPLDEFPVAEAAFTLWEAPVAALLPIEEEPEALEPTGPARFDRAQVSWTLVAASYTEQAAAAAAAEAYREKLEAYLVDVIEETVGGQAQYRVVVGQFQTLTETNAAQQELGDALPAGVWQLYFTAVIDAAREAVTPPADAAVATALPTVQESPAEDTVAVEERPVTQETPLDEDASTDEAAIADEETGVGERPVAEETLSDEEQPAQPPGPARFDRAHVSWTLVAASYTEPAAAAAAAEAYREKLEAYLVDVIEETVGGQTQYRVVVGQFQTLTQAQAAQQELGDALPATAWQLHFQAGQ